MKTTVACALGILLAVFVEATPCNPSSTALCLSGGRFEAKVTWTDFQGNSGDGQAIPLTPDTGYFWFFTNTNVELVVKVLDGRGLNGHFWVFYGALSNVQYRLTVRDSQTGDVQVYDNDPGEFGSKGDTSAFPPSSASVAAAARAIASRFAAPVGRRVDETRTASAVKHPAAACSPGDTALCLNAGRFRVESVWKDFAGNTGVGHAVGLTGDTGYFWFFGSTNVEAVVKVLDGRPLNNSFWVFYGALSNVEYTLTVTDTVTGIVKKYDNPSGLFASVGDTSAFGPPTTLQLIDGAVVKGEISDETALVYKIYALFGDARVPAAYVGIHPGQRDHGIVRQVAHRLPTLSPATQQLLKAYLAPPTAAGSWFAGVPPQGRSPERALDDWTKIFTTHAVVWYRAADTDAQTAASNLAGVVENVWSKETALFWEPLPDKGFTNDGGDGRLDIYVLPSFRDDFVQVKRGEKLAGVCMPFLDESQPTPAYILIRISEAKTVDGAGDVLAHEFFHAIFFAHGLGGDPDAYDWMDEATATWMEDHVYPNTNLEQGFATDYFTENYQHALDRPGDGGYAEYPFFFYLARSTGSGAVNAAIWNNASSMLPWQAINTAVSNGLKTQWPVFSLDCWDTPNVDDFKKWDNLWPGLLKDHASPRVVPLGNDGSAKLPLRAMRHLSMDYAYFHTDHEAIKRVEIQNSRLIQASEYAKVTAWVQLADGTTRVEDWTKKDRVVFCRDKATEKITDLLILYTNSTPDPDANPVLFDEGKLSYDSIGCGYQGTMHVKRHDPDGSADETIDVTATLVHMPGADFGNTVIYAAQRYTVKYQGTKKLNGCTDSMGPLEQTFDGSNVAASLITFDTSTSPPGYSAQAPFFMQGTETDICPDGTTERTSAAAGLWWDLPPGLFKVKPDGSLAETYTDGSRTYTWSFTPDTGDEGN